MSVSNPSGVCTRCNAVKPPSFKWHGIGRWERLCHACWRKKDKVSRQAVVTKQNNRIAHLKDVIERLGDKKPKKLQKWKRQLETITAKGNQYEKKISRLDARIKWKAAYHNALNSKRRCAELQATPKWVDFKAIERIYRECQEISSRTGVLHHVDHIIPLRGKKVCGLHVPWNLQVIPAEENLRKSNKLLAA